MAGKMEGRVIVPVIKKGVGKRVIIGVALISTLYKVYARVLAERLREEIEGIIPENQAEFKKSKGTLDNIYVLNYLVNRQLEKKGGKLTALFVNLKVSGQGGTKESNKGERN